MAVLIRNREIAPDSWLLLREEAAAERAAAADAADVIIPLRRWLASPETWCERAGRVGVWLAAGDDPALIAGSLHRFGVVAVDFPRFTDGRGYTTARLLRERYGWRGELRAIGDVQRDQLFYLARCGFDAFLLRDDADAPEALAAFRDFAEAYQAAADQPLPLFRRRAPGSA